MNETKTITSLVEFVCPFCGQRASAGNDEDGVPSVLHEIPGCAEFIELEPADFLHAVNQRLQN